MKYNPTIHHRRSIRLRDYDYSQEGAYFITICVQYMRCIFGHIEQKEMIMNEFGEIAYRQWEQLPERWPHIELGAFQVMPNHFHGIIIVNDAPVSGWAPARGAPAGAQPVASGNGETDPKTQWATKPTIGQIVGAYKSLVATECLKLAVQKYPGMFLGKVWQRNYWDDIIRDIGAFNRITTYIINNPAKWDEDRFFNAP
jgi:putative transposase